MADFLENDDDVLQMIQQIQKITKESKRKFEKEIDNLVDDTKKKLMAKVTNQKDLNKINEEQFKTYKENTAKYEKEIKDKHKTYQKLKAQLAEVANNYKVTLKDFYKDTESFVAEYGREKKELSELEEKEWTELNTECVELLKTTKTNLYAAKNEADEKLRKVLTSIL